MVTAPPAHDAAAIAEIAGYLTYDEGGSNEEFSTLPLTAADLAAGCTQNPVFLNPSSSFVSIIPDDCFWQIGHDGTGPDPSLFKARIFAPMRMEKPLIGIGMTPEEAVRASLAQSKGEE